ncbi:HDOD domain-containing protein [Trichlorobacter sp.]|jgi:putative nucleotidyltransferase with HDIG domain|uniref:HDOD domain-containing protein n=1 Tax=Trichlorobacter sp. TaxID=2911007 RepID=UPI002A36B28D|nr:HDOD domain-containing protein [Trichlorobacter sp.]MDY0384677.1 HDOD domain-containing protein [Trichlorobacter sp.]
MDTVLFQASLQFMSIHDILQWIDMNRITCVVTVSLEAEYEIVLYCEQGKLVFGTSRRQGASLGEALVKSGALKESVAMQAVTQSRAGGVSLTRYLLEQNLLSLPTLTNQFRQYLLSLLLDLLAATSGSVTVTAPAPAAVLGGELQLDVSRTLLDAVRLFDERSRDADTQRNEALELLSKRLYDEDFQLPALPSIVTQLNALLNDESATFQDMARVIMTDQVLISRILKVANSPFYGGSGQVDSIHFAIVRLGMREIMNIVAGIKLSSMQYGGLPQEKLQAILDTALKIAFTATGLARQCRLDPEEAFLGGLLLDLGKTVILTVAQDSDIEQGLLDELTHTRHAELGALIAQKWNYPETIQTLIRYHHAKNFGGMINKIHSVIQVADQLVCAEGSVEVVDPELLQALQLAPEVVSEVFASALTSFEQIKAT